MKSGLIALIEFEAPWSLLKERHLRVLVQGVDLSLETRAWDDNAASDFSGADSAKRQLLEADFADRRQKLLSSEAERAHWLSLFITALLCKAEVTIRVVKVRLDDAASKKGAGVGTASITFGLDLDLLQLIAEDGMCSRHLNLSQSSNIVNTFLAFPTVLSPQKCPSYVSCTHHYYAHTPTKVW